MAILFHRNFLLILLKFSIVWWRRGATDKCLPGMPGFLSAPLARESPVKGQEITFAMATSVKRIYLKLFFYVKFVKKVVYYHYKAHNLIKSK